ncbi:MAG: phenylacetate-CoA oxygenase subunit PaaI [Chitinophagaceae bacterium]|nr:MAG: phenylacetate-CoA oxygenase subunit PaaI [Chitinophagaceae bacterium]
MNRELLQYTLQLADNALILGHRNSEWCGHGPVLEQDIAISNIALDLIGQARNCYQYAALILNDDPSLLPEQKWKDIHGIVTEDSLAYFRDAHDFRNNILVEQPKGDWAVTILRQFFFSLFQELLFEKLKDCKDEQLAAIAVKSLKEIAYHLRWSSEWVIRLGDGTGESKERITRAITELWPYTNEMFVPASYETALITNTLVPDVRSLQEKWTRQVEEIFEAATISIPLVHGIQTNGKEGIHTHHLDTLLNALQSVARSQPEATW